MAGCLNLSNPGTFRVDIKQKHSSKKTKVFSVFKLVLLKLPVGADESFKMLNENACDLEPYRSVRRKMFQKTVQNQSPANSREIALKVQFKMWVFSIKLF